MSLSEEIAKIEQENKDLREQIETLRNQSNESPAPTILLDLLEPEVIWQEEHLKDIPKYKREWWDEMIKAYRELRPRGI